MPNGEEEELPEEEQPEEKAPPDLAGYGRRAYELGRGLGKKFGARKAASKAVGAGAKKAATGTAGKAAGAAAGTAVGGPLGTAVGAVVGHIASWLAEKFGPKTIKIVFYVFLIIAVIVAGMGVAIWGLLGGTKSIGGTPHVASAASTQNLTLALQGDVIALGKVLLSDKDKAKTYLDSIERQLKEISGPEIEEALKVVARLKELYEEISVASLQQKAMKEVNKQIQEQYEKLKKLIAGLSRGGLIDFTPKGVRVGAIGPGTRHPIAGKQWNIVRSKDPNIRERIAQVAESLVGQKAIDGMTWEQRGSGQCARLPNKVLAAVFNLSYEAVASIKYTGSEKYSLELIKGGQPGYIRGDIVHFYKPYSPYNTGNGHWAVAVGNYVPTSTATPPSLGGETKQNAHVAHAQTATGSLEDPDDLIPESQIENFIKMIEGEGIPFIKELSGLNEINNEISLVLEASQKARLILSEKDIEMVKAGKVDERVLKTLIYLVTPKELGGAGFERLKIKRLIKGYATERRSLSKETEYKNESERNLSAHHLGQAMDISEIDLIQRKKIKKKRIGGDKTIMLPPLPIKVAWQSESGKGEGVPGFFGDTTNQVLENLSIGSLKEVLSDELEYDLDALSGNDLKELVLSLGTIIISEDFDLPSGGFEEGTDLRRFLQKIGQETLAEILGLPAEGLKGSSKDDFLYNLGAAYLEEKLGLPPGSLSGGDLRSIFENTGRRKLEEEVGLKSKYDGNIQNRINQITSSPRWKIYKQSAEYGKNRGFPSGWEKEGEIFVKDRAFDLPKREPPAPQPFSTAELIEKGNKNGLVLAGAGTIAKALAIENKDELYNLILKGGDLNNFQFKIDEAGLEADVDPEILREVLSNDINKRRAALIKLGSLVLGQVSSHYDLSLGLSRADWEAVLRGKKKIDDLVIFVGARKLEEELDLPLNCLYYQLTKGGNLLVNIGRAALEEAGKKPSGYSEEQLKTKGKEVLAKTALAELNKEWRLDERYKITEEDLLNLLQGRWWPVALKVGEKHLEEGLGLPPGGGMDLILYITGQGGRDPLEILREAAAIKLGRLVGLSGAVSLEGVDFKNPDAALKRLRINYGQAFIEETLGLLPGSFVGSLSEIITRNSEERIRVVFKNFQDIDAIFGLPGGTTEKLFTKQITPDEYKEMVAKRQFKRWIEIEVKKKWFGSSVEEKVSDVLIELLFENQTQKLTPDELKNFIKAIIGEGKSSAAIEILGRIFGESLDDKLGFDPGTIERIVREPNNASKILIEQGVFILASKIIPIKEGKVTMDDVRVLVRIITSGDKISSTEYQTVVNRISEITGIPDKADAEAFINGNIKHGLLCWGIAELLEEVNSYLPNEAKLAYQQVKLLYFGDKTKEEQALTNLIAEKGIDWWNSRTPEQREEIWQTIRKEVRSDGRKELEYRIIDAYLRKEMPEIPLGFAKTILEGTPEDRQLMMASLAVNLLGDGKLVTTPDQLYVLKKFLELKDTETLEELKQTGFFGVLDKYIESEGILKITISGKEILLPITSEDIFKYMCGGEEAKKVTEALQSKGYDIAYGLLADKVSYFIKKIGIFDYIKIKPDQVPVIFSFIQNPHEQGLLEKLKSMGVFTELDGHLNKLLGGLAQSGLSEALFEGFVENDWNPLNNLYKQALKSQLFSFGDKILGLPVGSTYQLYQAYQEYQKAYATYKEALKVGDATKIKEAKKALKEVKDAGISLAIHLLFGKQLAKLDEALGVGPGFTEGLVVYLVTGNPIALVVGIAKALFGTYKIELYVSRPVCEIEEGAQTETGGLIMGKKFSRWIKISGNPKKDFPIYQRHARCSVKRMISSLLDMPDKLGDRKWEVIQLITQRKDDVDYFHQDPHYGEVIARLYGKTPLQRGLSGLMSSDLMWQWIHVGW